MPYHALPPLCNDVIMCTYSYVGLSTLAQSVPKDFEKELVKILIV